MTAPLADQLLDALGEPTIRGIARRLLSAPATQGELIDELGCNQSTVSRGTLLLRTLGVVSSSGAGKSATFTVTTRDELVAVLLAADRLAEALIRRASDQQGRRSTETRRLAVRPAGDEPHAEQEDA